MGWRSWWELLWLGIKHNMTGMENGWFLMGYGWDFVWLYGSDTIFNDL